MKLFKSHHIEVLENNNERLLKENLELVQQKCKLETQIFNVYGKELCEEIADILELSSKQKAKLSLIFSVERARLAGVPEDKILHNIEEVDAFFMSEES